MYEQVILLCIAKHKLMLDVPIEDIRHFRRDVMDYFEANHSEIIDEINEKKVLSPELEDSIVKAAKEYKQS